MEWVPRDENAFKDDISKMLTPEDSMLCKEFFLLLDGRRGPHILDLFLSSANNQCDKFYALHWCMRTTDINAFGQFWTGENCWINCPYNMIGKVWRTLREHKGLATILIPL